MNDEHINKLLVVRLMAFKDENNANVNIRFIPFEIFMWQ